MAPSTRSKKSSTPESQSSKNPPIQKKKDVEKDAKIAELEEIIAAQALEIENLKKKSLERSEKDSKKLEAAKKIIDAQKKQIIEQVVDRIALEDLKAENALMKSRISTLQQASQQVQAPAQPAPEYIVLD